jgi:hypothetical protein
MKTKMGTCLDKIHWSSTRPYWLDRGDRHCAGAADVLLRLATRSDSLPYYDNLGLRLQGLVARTANSKSIQPLVSMIPGAVHGWGKGEWEVLQSKTSGSQLRKACLLLISGLLLNFLQGEFLFNNKKPVFKTQRTSQTHKSERYLLYP